MSFESGVAFKGLGAVDFEDFIKSDGKLLSGGVKSEAT